jgi:RNA polymerase sigma factor (sigma-70 family)
MNKKKIENIYSSESKKMLKYIRKSLNQSLESIDEKDLLQDTFYSLLNGIDITKPIDNLTAYIYTSIRHRIIDLFRKKKLDFDDHVQMDEIAIDDLVIKQIQQQETLELIYKALDQLPKSQKEIFIKTEIDGKTFQTISDESGVSINTLLSQKKYALKKLRELLSDE